MWKKYYNMPFNWSQQSQRVFTQPLLYICYVYMFFVIFCLLLMSTICGEKSLFKRGASFTENRTDLKDVTLSQPRWRGDFVVVVLLMQRSKAWKWRCTPGLPVIMGNVNRSDDEQEMWVKTQTGDISSQPSGTCWSYVKFSMKPLLLGYRRNILRHF